MRKARKSLGVVLAICIVTSTLPITALAETVKSEDGGSTFSELSEITANTGSTEVNETNHRYEVYETSMTWTEAEAYCENIGGHLVTITSENEMNTVINLIPEEAKNCYWIGLYRDDINLEWKWITGETVSYTNWAEEEPNNDREAGECYTHLFGLQYTGGTNLTKYVGQWNDVTDQGASYASSHYDLANFGFICEYESEDSAEDESESENSTEDEYGSEDSIDSEYRARIEWINKHIEYATSEAYNQQVVQGFTGTLNNTFEAIKNDGMITAYNTLDSINTILDFDIDLTDSQEYELLLAQILFSRNGVTSIEEIYAEYYPEAVITFCEWLLSLGEFVEGLDEEQIESYKQLIDTIKGLTQGTTEFNDTFNQLLGKLGEYDDFNFSESYVKAYKQADFNFVSGFLSDQIGMTFETLQDCVIYFAACEAYMDTSDMFGETLLELRKHIAIPSDDSRFAPYSVDEALVTDRMIWTELGLKNANNSIGPDPLNTPIYLSALATAIENYYNMLESYQTDGASAVATKVVAEYAEGTLDNLLDAGINVVVSLFECPPVVREFEMIKNLFDGTQFVIDTFTGIDDRAYMGTMVMRLYCIAYIHYLTVDGLASGDWYTLPEYSASITPTSLEEYQFDRAARFDEAVTVYRAILSVAAEYAKEYYALYYNFGDTILQQHYDPFSKTNRLISALETQQVSLGREWCHIEIPLYYQINRIATYESSYLVVYSFKCPVSVTVKNEIGEVIAVLSNGNSYVATGYDHYFFTTETVKGSGDYLKIAVVPRTYSVIVEGTGTGTMDAIVSGEDELSEVQYFLDVPITEGTVGYFVDNTDGSELKDLILDGTTYNGSTNLHMNSITKVEGFAATCTEEGQKTYYVCECGRWFEDEFANVEITDKSTVVIPALGHDWQDATCIQPKTCKVCGATEGSKNNHVDTDQDGKCDICGNEGIITDQSAPPTGDGRWFLWMILLGMSGVSVISFISYGKQKKRNE